MEEVSVWGKSFQSTGGAAEAAQWCWWDVLRRRKLAGERRCRTGSLAVRRRPSAS